MATATYQQFLASPAQSMLASDATLHYVTTITSVTGASEIIKHLIALRSQVKKKSEKILDVVEGTHAIATQVETELEFVASGGQYLPGMDDNFLSDRTVHLPIMHIVTFDAQYKIVQIRLSWDQGALLKQLDVIGKMGRNWPIRDSREQITMISACLRKTANLGPAIDTSTATAHSSNALRDPHAPSALFGPHGQAEGGSDAVVSPYAGSRPAQRSFADILGDQPEGTAADSVVSPYAGSRPPQRSFREILGNDSDDEPPSPSGTHQRSVSPAKTIAPKAGAGKSYQPSRLFDRDDIRVEDDTPEKKASDRYVRPNPNKYQHFDLADGSEDTPRPLENRAKSKHDSNWSFDDFMTPHKPTAGKAYRHQDVRHWDTEADKMPETPANQRPPPPKPRRDNAAHFEMQDDGIRSESNRPPIGRPRGAVHNERLHLYDNRNGAALSGEEARALGNITNVKDRRKDFDPHFAMTDNSPSQSHMAAHPVQEDRMKAVKMMDASWSNYDVSPAQKENKPRNEAGNGATRNGEDRGINIKGDGMGGLKNTDRSWMYGAPLDIEDDGINIKGDGMGGLKGTDRSWLYGGDAQEAPAIPARKQGAKTRGPTSRDL